MVKFGQTWWGEQWLNALSHIDYSNRLPRGRKYARNGSVVSITIKANQIKAKVQGTRRTPYKVEISVPEFKEADKRKLIKKVTSNPLIISKLVNRELPVELFKLAEKNKIRIFPQSWKDLGMHCSCPDWAVPCKHIAALINIIANEIDKDPFVIFKLHGLNLLQEIENKGFTTQTDKSRIPPITKFLNPTISGDFKNDTDNLLKDIDFSTIPDLKDNILSLLDDNTIFSNKSFKPVLKRAYTKTSRGIIQDKNNFEANEDIDFTYQYERFTNAELIINNDFFYFDTILYSENDEKHFSKQTGFVHLIGFLQNIPAKYIDRLSPKLKALYFIYHFAAKLTEKNAYIPQILQLPDGDYFIRQIPALINEEVRTIYDIIVKITPPDIVQVIEKNNKIKYFSPEEQVTLISSLFIDYFVYSFYGNTVKNDIISELFFAYESCKFDKIDEKGTADAIYKWLGKFYMARQNYVPVIKVDESKDNYFAVNMLVESKKDSLKEPVSLNQFLTHKKYANDRFAVFEALSNLSNHFSDLSTIIASSGEEELVYDSETFTDILLEIIPVIKLLGIKILLPKSLKNLVRPKNSLLLNSKTDSHSDKTYLNLNEMLSFDWQIAIGDKHISVDEFKKIVKDVSGIVKIKDQYVLINRNEIQTLLNNLQKDNGLKPNELLQVALTEEYQSAKIKISAEAKEIIYSLLAADKVKLPKEIKAIFRPYQKTGYEWLYKNSKIGFGSIIADDMGLGKTLQVLATIQQLKNENRLQKETGLVIVPTTLLTNWAKEIEKFAPDLSYHIYHGTNRALITDNIELIITTYGIARSDEKILAKKKWAFVVIDEAQNIKNPGTAQTKAVKKLKSGIKIAMSGTPVENRLSEYWSIFDFTNKNYLGNIKYFKKEFAKPIENDRDHEKLNKFKRITEPFIIRRLKTDKKIISDLPDKIQNDKYANLTKEQTALYQNIVDNVMTEITKTEDDSIQRKGLVLKLITALKQVCNHPSQFLKRDDINPELSGKAMILLNLLERIFENNEKVLIFTQYKEMGLLLEKMIYKQFHTETMFLHGGVPRKKRDQMVEDFQTKPHLKAFILSIKAAGTGLNLTAANNVIHYDLWWNPAVENQATDRAFRIGQDKNVMVYRLITQKTFEEKINEMINSKKELADLTVAAGEKWIGNLSNKELTDLVEL